MESAEVYFATTSMSIDKIARLVGMRYSAVRDHLFKVFDKEFVAARKKSAYAKHKHGKKNPRFGQRPSNFIGRAEDGRGYYTVCKPDWYTGRKKYARVFEHHVVICRELGITEIPRGFCVHHIDRDSRNNDPSNLALMTLGAHSKLHSLLKGSETIRKEYTKRSGGSARHVSHS